MEQKRKGNLTELQCISKFVEAGFICSIPYGEASKYDFIADNGKQLYRIQVKTSQIKNGIIKFPTLTKPFQQKCKYTKENIDYFATSANNKIFIVPVEDAQCRIVNLHLSKPKNNQQKHIKYAENYLFEHVF